MEIKWEVEDGYVGKSRPQYATITKSDLEDCDTREEKEARICAIVQEEFEESVSWGLSDDMDTIIADIEADNG